MMLHSDEFNKYLVTFVRAAIIIIGGGGITNSWPSVSLSLT